MPKLRKFRKVWLVKVKLAKRKLNQNTKIEDIWRSLISESRTCHRKLNQNASKVSKLNSGKVTNCSNQTWKHVRTQKKVKTTEFEEISKLKLKQSYKVSQSNLRMFRGQRRQNQILSNGDLGGAPKLKANLKI